MGGHWNGARTGIEWHTSGLENAFGRHVTFESYTMSQRLEANPPSEHARFLRLFITNGGGL